MKFTKNKLCFLIVIIIVITAVSFFTLSVHEGASGNIVKASVSKPLPTLIIDAGHGGADGGAVSLTGAKESEINLDIAIKLDQIMGFFGVRSIMTRTSEILDYSEKADTIREKKAEDQNNRLKLIKSTENAVLISIHQNKFTDGSPFGAQVLFAPTSGSKEFGEAMQDILIQSLNPKSRRTASKVPNSILLLNHISCPGLIVECGFLSNNEEERLLMTNAYRLKVAAVISSCYLLNQSSLYDINSGGTDEG